MTHDQLIIEIWGDEPPRRVTAGLHVYVSQLRKFLCSIDGRAESPVATRSPGYLLRLGSDELDLHTFIRLVEDGRVELAAGDLASAAARFEAALRLYRGPVLDGLHHGPMLEGFVSWVTESHLECLELLLDTQLMMGRHREVVGRLHALVAENPLRESLYHRLMLALYRSQRTADALRVFAGARRTLLEELGLEPGRQLRDLQRAILRADEDLEYWPKGRPEPRATTFGAA